MKCSICLKEFKKANKLSLHLNDHNISKKEYYDKYLKKENEGVCYCGNFCNFKSLTTGYHTYCSSKCLSNDKKIILKRTEKFKGENHWIRRTGSHPTRGKNYEELFGEMRAKELKGNLVTFGKCLIGEKNHFYGKHHTTQTKEVLSNFKKNKTYEEMYGQKKANIIKQKMRKEGKKERDYYLEYNNRFYCVRLRKSILLDQDFKCALCLKAINKKFSKNLLHINYIKKDSRRRNLIYLCLSCHAKTNKDRTLWKTRLRCLNREIILLKKLKKVIFI